MTEHHLNVEQGGEYKGECYISCCHAPNGGDETMFEGDTVEELVAFLEQHGAIGDERIRAYLDANPAAFREFLDRARRTDPGWWDRIRRRHAALERHRDERIHGTSWP